MNHTSPLFEKIFTPVECKIQRSFAVWSDLLGFGKKFVDADWRPEPDVWNTQAKRASNAYRIQCANVHMGSGESYMLLLNDGMVRSLTWKEKYRAIDLGMWLKSAVFAHSHIYNSEKSLGLPGPRTIISSGWIAEHSFDEVRFDDLVLNYTRQKPGLSKIAQQTGNPILAANPSHLQLNTAFSRAFLLDEAGSSAGISGANIYIDQAFIDAVIEEFDNKEGIRVNNWLRENDRVFSVEFLTENDSPITQDEILTLNSWLERQELIDYMRKNGKDPFPSRRQLWAFGFLLEKQPIEVNLTNLKTKVYRVEGYFPNDEDPADFMIDTVSRP